MQADDGLRLADGEVDEEGRDVVAGTLVAATNADGHERTDRRA